MDKMLEELILRNEKYLANGISIQNEHEIFGKTETIAYHLQKVINSIWRLILKELNALAKRGSMELNKENNNLETIALEVLDECPANETKAFTDGYVEFVSVFFEELDIITSIFPCGKGMYFVEIEFICQETSRLLNEKKYSKEFWRGARLAEYVSLKALVDETRGLKKRSLTKLRFKKPLSPCHIIQNNDISKTQSP